MKRRWSFALAVALSCWLSASAPAQDAGVVDAAPADEVAAIDRIVRASFYSADRLGQVQWADHVRKAREQLRGTTAADRPAILAALVRQLATSHTEYLWRDEPRYWQLLSIFQDILAKPSDRCPDPRKLPPMPIEVADIGVWWTQRDGRWFVGGVFDDSPAQRAGLLLGDEIVTADGKPFRPVAAFAGGPTRTVALGVRRKQGSALRTVTLRPHRAQPREAFRAALAASARIVVRGQARVAYVHVWSWAGDEMQEELEAAIAELNRKRPTAFVVDLRDGWGGASPDFLRIFDARIPVLESVDRRGRRFRHDPQIRVPAVVLINGGSRSGKEIIAHGIQRHHLARLVGEPTGGAVLPGSVFCLDDGAILYLAVSALTVDGEVLEGKGVAPDVAVPFDLRYAAGVDPQLEAAIDLAARGR